MPAVGVTRTWSDTHSGMKRRSGIRCSPMMPPEISMMLSEASMAGPEPPEPHLCRKWASLAGRAEAFGDTA